MLFCVQQRRQIAEGAVGQDSEHKQFPFSRSVLCKIFCAVLINPVIKGKTKSYVIAPPNVDGYRIGFRDPIHVFLVLLIRDLRETEFLQENILVSGKSFFVDPLSVVINIAGSIQDVRVIFIAGKMSISFSHIIFGTLLPFLRPSKIKFHTSSSKHSLSIWDGFPTPFPARSHCERYSAKNRRHPYIWPRHGSIRSRRNPFPGDYSPGGCQRRNGVPGEHRNRQLSIYNN